MKNICAQLHPRFENKGISVSEIKFQIISKNTVVVNLTKDWLSVFLEKQFSERNKAFVFVNTKLELYFFRPDSTVRLRTKWLWVRVPLQLQKNCVFLNQIIFYKINKKNSSSRSKVAIFNKDVLKSFANFTKKPVSESLFSKVTGWTPWKSFQEQLYYRISPGEIFKVFDNFGTLCIKWLKPSYSNVFLSITKVLFEPNT